MRILAIRGRNLASLAGDFEVDLEAPPLGGQGLVAITGPIGAGKSTLLDALCLALFNTTPRLDGRGGVAIPAAGEALPSRDVRQMLRRGTAEGAAEVDFEGVDGRRWRARWSVRRARGSPEGRHQPVELALTDLTTGREVGGRLTESLDAIQAQLGLDFGQFRRSVLLAQGDFAAFLTASEGDRASLLESLTGSAVYGVVSQRAFHRHREEQRMLGELARRAGEVQVLAAAERTRMEVELAEADRREVELVDGERQAQGWLTWHEHSARLEAALVEAEHRLGGATQASDELLELRAELEAVLRAAPLLDVVERERKAEVAAGAVRGRAAELRRQLSDAEAQATAADRDFALARERLATARLARESASAELERATGLDARLVELEQVVQASARALAEQRRLHDAAALACAEANLEHDRRRAAFEATSAWLTQHRGWEGLVVAWPAVKADLERLVAVRAGLVVADARLVEARRALGEAERASVRADGLEGALRTEVAEVDRELKAARGRLSRRPLAPLQERLLQVSAEQAVVGGLSKLLGSVRLREGELVRSLERSDREGAALVELEARRELAEVVFVEARDRDEEAAKGLRRQQAEAELAGRRHLLEPGQPCPLCGALEHPWAGQQDPDDGALAVARDLAGTCHHALLAAISELRELREASGEARARHQARAEASQRAREELDQALRQWHEELDRVRIDVPRLPALAAGILGALQAQAEAQVAAARRELEDREALAVEVENLAERRETAREALETASLARQARRDAVATLGARVVAAATELERLTVEARALTSAVREQVGALAEGAALEEDVTGTLAAWAEVTGAFASRRARREDERREHEQARSRLEARTAELLASARALGERQSAAADAVERSRSLGEARAACLAGRPVAQVRAELGQAVSVAEQSASATEARRAELERSQVSLRSQLEALEDTARQRAAELEEARTHLGGAREALGVDAAGLARLLSLAGTWAEGARERIDAADRAVQGARAIRSEAARSLAQHRDGQTRPARAQAEEVLNAMLAERRELVERRADLRARLRQDDEALAGHGQMLRAIAAQQITVDRWKELSDLIGSADGKKLRTFAQGLTLASLLEGANSHLRDLAPRFRVDRVPGSDMELLVVDGDLADEPRSVQSLSGGEGFLVSLALALALSDLASHRIQVDSLFIDEGFGTLDPEALELALHALDALQVDGRQVTLISHVPGLAERIGATVSVVPVGQGASRVVTGRAR